MKRIKNLPIIVGKKSIGKYDDIIRKLTERLKQTEIELNDLKIKNQVLMDGILQDSKNESEVGNELLPKDIQEMLDNGEYAEIQTKFIRQIPWNNNDLPNIDMRFAENVLNRSHYGMAEVKERFLKYIACQKHIGKNYGTVLLLVGPPGVGKTSISKILAEAMGREFAKISLAGEASALSIKGYDENYSNPYPGKIVEAIIRAQSMCPLILLDEVDKMGMSSEQGSAESALIDLLDSDRTKFVDNLINLPIDLSNVIFIATANVTTTISPILLNRMKVIRLKGYTLEEKVEIADKYLLPNLMKEYNLTNQNLEIHIDTLRYIIETYTTEPGIRTLEQILRELCETIIYNMQLGIDYSHDITISIFNLLMGYTPRLKKDSKHYSEKKKKQKVLKRAELYH